MFDVSRVTTKGQITIPVEFRKRFGINKGDRVVFIERDGMILIATLNRMAFEEFQRAMVGEAEKAGIASECDVVNLCREVRADLAEGRDASNA